MAVTITQNTNLHTNRFRDVTLNSTATEIKTATGTLFAIEIDNSDNEAACYVKLWNSASAPSVGTTVPDDVIKVPGGKADYVRVFADRRGVTYGSGVFAACTTAGGTAGSTAPTNVVKATLWTS